MKIISIIMAIILSIVMYPVSFLSVKTDDSFDIDVSVMTENTVVLNGEETAITVSDDAVIENGVITLTDEVKIEINKMLLLNWFNYYGICYSSDAYIEGEICYNAGVKVKSESFYLEPGENVTFYSFIDNMLNGTKANSVNYVTFKALDCESASLEIKGLGVFNRSIPDEEIYIQNGCTKIGVNLLWGGALSYLEDLDSDVQAVVVDGTVRVDSDAAERYDTESVNDHVNLINRADAGRLVQQSYYGTGNSDEYEADYYNATQWNYNPVQGGNKYNDNSKIVDVKIENDMIYIKCQPLDWAKSKEYITPSYMEAYYSLENGTLHVSCRFVDFSGYESAYRTQEMPAFYCIAPLSNYVYSTDSGLVYEKDLIFWPDAGYPNFTSNEGWSAFVGEFEDSFGIGLYVPDENTFLAGIYNRDTTTNTNPDKDAATSYIAVVKNMTFESFSPIEYDYYITTGNVDEIRNTFLSIKQPS